MDLLLHEFHLPLLHPFGISRSTVSQQPTLIVELRSKTADGQTVRGYGEATANDYYGVTIDSMRQTLESLRGDIETAKIDQPEAMWAKFAPAFRSDRFAQCALDTAIYDLFGKLAKKPLHQLWGISSDPGMRPASSFTIGLDATDVMVDKLLTEPGWSVYKIKLGTGRDIDIVRQLRQVTDRPFRVDANAAWTAGETLDKAALLADLGVELIEQPLAADDVAGMRMLKGRCPLPIIADESCQVESDVERCAAQGFDGINIKLVKCGGLTPARQMLKQARRLSLRTMVGCMTESTVGISAAAQLLSLVDYADLDGANLLAADIATGVIVERGGVQLADSPGLGVKLDAQN